MNSREEHFQTMQRRVAEAERQQHRQEKLFKWSTVREPVWRGASPYFKPPGCLHRWLSIGPPHRHRRGSYRQRQRCSECLRERTVAVWSPIYLSWWQKP
jgi:hypothetical protein